MYTEIKPSVHYGEDKIAVGFLFDMESFNSLADICIFNIVTCLKDFKESKGKISKETLMKQIGVSVEILEHGVFLMTRDKEIRFDKKTAEKIKDLFQELEKLISSLGENDWDFISMSMTKRARPKDYAVEIIEKAFEKPEKVKS